MFVSVKNVHNLHTIKIVDIPKNDRDNLDPAAAMQRFGNFQKRILEVILYIFGPSYSLFTIDRSCCQLANDIAVPLLCKMNFFS